MYLLANLEKYIAYNRYITVIVPKGTSDVPTISFR